MEGNAAGDCGELLVSLCYQPAADRLTVIVLRAKNLPRMDLTGLSGIFKNLLAMTRLQNDSYLFTHWLESSIKTIFAAQSCPRVEEYS